MKPTMKILYIFVCPKSKLIMKQNVGDNCHCFGAIRENDPKDVSK
jgi:hypothetical protein